MALALRRSVCMLEAGVPKQQLFKKFPVFGLCSSVVSNRGLKTHMLHKKKKKRKTKFRDGKEKTVDELYWELYFKENPQILQEREQINLKQSTVQPTGKKPLSPRKIYETLTSSDKRLTFAAVFALVSGFIAMKITFA